jgi:hypothetical protein
MRSKVKILIDIVLLREWIKGALKKLIEGIESNGMAMMVSTTIPYEYLVSY